MPTPARDAAMGREIIAELLNWLEPSCRTVNPPDDPCDKGWHNAQILAIRRAQAYLAARKESK